MPGDYPKLTSEGVKRAQAAFAARPADFYDPAWDDEESETYCTWQPPCHKNCFKFRESAEAALWRFEYEDVKDEQCEVDHCNQCDAWHIYGETERRWS